MMRSRALAATLGFTVGIGVASSVGASGSPVDPPSVPSRVLRYDGPAAGADVAADVAVATTGVFFVTGWSYGGLVGGDDFTTVAYRPGGRQLWVASYDGPDQNVDQALAVAVDPGSARVAVTGNSFGGPGTVTDIATVVHDVTTGERLWVARYDGQAHDTDAGADVAMDPGGEVIFVTGASVGQDGSLDLLTLAYDAMTGAQLWEARSGGAAGADEPFAVGVSNDGSRVFVTGYRTGPVSIDFVTVAYDAASGTELWQRSLDGGGEEVARSLAISPDGSSVYVTGYSSGGPTTAPSRAICVSGDRWQEGPDYITVAYDAATGARRWAARYDGPDHDCDEAYAVGVDPAGGAVFVTGSSFGQASDSDAATVAYDAATGQQLWASRFDGPDGLYDKGDSLVVDPNGRRVYVAGSSIGATTDWDYLTLFLDAATGELLSSHRYDGPGHGFDATNAIAVGRSGGGLYVTGGSAGAIGSQDYGTLVFRLRP